MIPDFDQATGYLPPGVHIATWMEVEQRFAVNSPRVQLASGLLGALKNLAGAGCPTVLLDGSFVTEKPVPRDFDGAWEIQGVDSTRVDPVLLDFSKGRAAMKAKYGGELFPASLPAAPGITYRDFFQADINGVAKGIIEINLGSLP